jgi:hypothetical protein
MKNDSEPMFKETQKSRYEYLHDTHMQPLLICMTLYSHMTINSFLTHFYRITCCRLHRQNHAHKSSPAPPILLLAYADSSVAIHQFKELAQDSSERELTLEDYLTELA